MTDSLDRLHDGVEGLRSRARSGGVPAGALMVAGGVLVPLGLGLILLGWYGTAQSTLEFEQLPYVVSGGILGLALTVTGALLYGLYWLTLLVQDGRARDARDAAHQARVEAALEALRTPAPTRTTAPKLVVTSGGSMLHRPDCTATAGQAVRKVTRTEGLALCGLCQPERALA